MKNSLSFQVALSVSAAHWDSGIVCIKYVGSINRLSMNVDQISYPDLRPGPWFIDNLTRPLIE